MDPTLTLIRTLTLTLTPTPTLSLPLTPTPTRWTPRARPKDAPKQSARYQSQFKAIPTLTY